MDAEPAGGESNKTSTMRDGRLGGGGGVQRGKMCEGMGEGDSCEEWRIAKAGRAQAKREIGDLPLVTTRKKKKEQGAGC